MAPRDNAASMWRSPGHDLRVVANLLNGLRPTAPTRKHKALRYPEHPQFKKAIGATPQGESEREETPDHRCR